MTAHQLLPHNSTALEIALTDAMDSTADLSGGISSLHSFKYANPLHENIVPWLINDYGLGSITPYHHFKSDAVLLGVPWLKVKGTPKAVSQALNWIGYSLLEMYEMPVRRMRWNLFELELNKLPLLDTDLDAIEQLTWLSQPVRSDFWRAYCGYNIRELDWSYTSWGAAIWGDCSGVRLHEGGVKWSFGRTHIPIGGSYAFTESELRDLEAWVPSTGEQSITWQSLSNPWSVTTFPWESDDENARAAVIAALLLPKSLWVTLLRADMSVIGSRKAKEYLPVLPSLAGPFEIAGTTYSPSRSDVSRIYAEALTDFGEGAGNEVRYWCFTFGASLPAGQPAGAQWVSGNSLQNGKRVGLFPIPAALKLQPTTRESFRAVLRIE